MLVCSERSCCSSMRFSGSTKFSTSFHKIEELIFFCAALPGRRPGCNLRLWPSSFCGGWFVFILYANSFIAAVEEMFNFSQYLRLKHFPRRVAPRAYEYNICILFERFAFVHRISQDWNYEIIRATEFDDHKLCVQKIISLYYDIHNITDNPWMFLLRNIETLSSHVLLKWKFVHQTLVHGWIRAV